MLTEVYISVASVGLKHIGNVLKDCMHNQMLAIYTKSILEDKILQKL